MAFEVPGLWAARNEWPIAPLNFVFLLAATDQIGLAMCGPNWKVPPFRGDDDAGNQQFERVITTVAKACESGEMPAYCRRPDGVITPMEPADWHLSPALDWQIYFHSGQMSEIDLDIMEKRYGEIQKRSFSIAPAISICSIFVRRADLNQFIEAVQSKRSAVVKPVVSREALREWARDYIDSLAGNNPNQKKMWAAAKTQMPGALYKDVIATMKELAGNPGRGRIKSKSKSKKS
jgi:hypothetical protein